MDPSAPFDAVELSRPEWVKAGCRLGQRVEGFPAIAGSDAHFLEDVGRLRLELLAPVSSIHELIREVVRLS